MAEAVSQARYRIGIDTGGTFTDIVSVDTASGAIAVTKVSSTPANPGIALARGVRAILEQAMMDIMFEVPSAGAAIREVVINEDTIQKGAQPILMYQKGVAVAGGERAS